MLTKSPNHCVILMGAYFLFSITILNEMNTTNINFYSHYRMYPGGADNPRMFTRHCKEDNGKLCKGPCKRSANHAEHNTFGMHIKGQVQ